MKYSIAHTNCWIPQYFIMHITAVRDMYVTNDAIYFISRNYGTQGTFLNRIDINNHDDFITLIELPQGMTALTVADNIIYLADGEAGVLMYFEAGEIHHLAGVAGDNAFIDGTALLFYHPTRIRYFENALYIWDFNVLSIEKGAVQLNAKTELPLFIF